MNKQSGVIKTRFVFDPLIQDNPLASSKWWQKLVWKAQGPIKCRFFIWLLLEGKILTLDILVK